MHDTLQLSVAVSDNKAAPRGVLMFLTGGPGQPGLPSLLRNALRLAPVLSAYRLVMIDQRGTGAGAIQCPALQLEVGTSDIAVPLPAAVRDCAERLGERRVPLLHGGHRRRPRLAAARAGRGPVDARRRVVRDLRRGALCRRAPSQRQGAGAGLGAPARRPPRRRRALPHRSARDRACPTCLVRRDLVRVRPGSGAELACSPRRGRRGALRRRRRVGVRRSDLPGRARRDPLCAAGRSRTARLARSGR